MRKEYIKPEAELVKFVEVENIMSTAESSIDYIFGFGTGNMPADWR